MNNLKRINIKNLTCYYSNKTIKFADFILHNILLDKKSYENIFVYNISCKSFIDAELCLLGSIKQMDLLQFYDGTIYSVLFGGVKLSLNLQQNQISNKSKKWYNICYLSSLCKNQS